MKGTLAFLVALYICVCGCAIPSDKHKWFLKDSPLAKFISIEQKYKQSPTFISYAQEEDSTPNPLIPVVIIPSLIGTQLWAQLNNSSPPHWYCDSNADLYQLFFVEEQFYPFIINCWMANMMMYYDPTWQVYSGPEGVEISEPDWGGVDSIEYLSPDQQGPVWNLVISALVNNSYTIGKNIRAAPYDWRVGPNAYPQYFSDLQTLIEETYEMNANTPVALASLSMGSPVTLLFLNYMTQTWKDKYIYSWTSFSGPFGGSSWAAAALIGYYPGLPSYVDMGQFRSMLQSFGSLPWLLPTTDVFGTEKVFIATTQQNYTATQWVQLLQDAQAEPAEEILQDITKLRSFSPPGVATNCFMGYNLSTLAMAYFNKTFNDPYTPFFEDGDGTVLTPSLEVCATWASEQSQTVNVYRVPNMQHGTDIHVPEVVQQFLLNIGINTTITW